MTDNGHRDRAANGGPPNGGQYRVEHRLENREPAVLARIEGCYPHHAELAPYNARLRLDGHTRGIVVLVDEATGEVVARRYLERMTPPRPASPIGRADAAPTAPSSSPAALRLPPSLRRR